jgi:hypothetical protein
MDCQVFDRILILVCVFSIFCAESGCTRENLCVALRYKFVNSSNCNVTIRDEQSIYQSGLHVAPDGHAELKWSMVTRSVEGRKAYVEYRSADSVVTCFSTFSIDDKTISNHELVDMALATTAGDQAAAKISIQDNHSSIRYPGLPLFTIVLTDDVEQEVTVDRNWEVHFQHKQRMNITLRSDDEMDFCLDIEHAENGSDLCLSISIEDMTISSTACNKEWSFSQQLGSIDVHDVFQDHTALVLAWRRSESPEIDIQATGPGRFKRFKTNVGSPRCSISTDLLYRAEKMANDFYNSWVEETENVIKPVDSGMTIMSLADFSMDPFTIALCFDGDSKSQPLISDSSLAVLQSLQFSFSETPISFTKIQLGSHALPWRGTKRDLTGHIQKVYTNDALSHWASIIKGVVESSANQSITGRSAHLAGGSLRLVGDVAGDGIKMFGSGIESGIRIFTGDKQGGEDDIASKVGAGIGGVGSILQFGVGSVATGFEALGAGVGFFGNKAVSTAANAVGIEDMLSPSSGRQSSSSGRQLSSRQSDRSSTEMLSVHTRDSSSGRPQPDMHSLGRSVSSVGTHSMNSIERNLMSSGSQVGRAFSASMSIFGDTVRTPNSTGKDKEEKNKFLGGLF